MSRPVQVTVAVMALLVITFLILGYRALDDDGWVPHTRDTEVTGYDTWPAGQERNCVTLPAQDGAIIFLGCLSAADSTTTQAVPVKYWGRIRRPDRFTALTVDPHMETWKWRCRKKGSSVTCWAVN